MKVPYSHMAAGRGERGLAVIELALTLVFLLLLTIGITEFGRAFWYYSAMQAATREGARCLSMLGWDNTAPVGDCMDTVWRDANAAGVRPVLTQANVQVECDDTTCSWGSGGAPEYVTVAIVDYNISWIWGLGGGGMEAGQQSPINVVATMPYMR